MAGVDAPDGPARVMQQPSRIAVAMIGSPKHGAVARERRTQARGL